LEDLKNKVLERHFGHKKVNRKRTDDCRSTYRGIHCIVLVVTCVYSDTITQLL
jgi:hypothetical protein